MLLQQYTARPQELQPSRLLRGDAPRKLQRNVAHPILVIQPRVVGQAARVPFLPVQVISGIEERQQLLAAKQQIEEAVQPQDSTK